MSELENSVIETAPTKSEQSKTLADAMADFKKKGGTVDVQPPRRNLPPGSVKNAAVLKQQFQ